jgi:AAA+ superfamily predicted ATPase
MSSWLSTTLETSPATSDVSSVYPALHFLHNLTQPVFLCELEYFRGIIFLTTNSFSTIDPAFRSRVSIHLVFRSPPFYSRLILWGNFLARLPADEVHAKVSKKDLQELAKWELNGREIKNSIKTVRTWCVCKGFHMNLLRLESGIKVTAPQAKKVEEIEG